MKNKKLKIARIVSEKFPVPPDKGGAIQTSVYYSSLILKDELDITIFSRPTDSQKNDLLNYEPIDYSFLEKISEKILQTKLGKIFIFRFFFKAMINYKYLNKCIKKIDDSYDLILVHNVPAFIPKIRKKNKTTKIILSMHNLHLSHGKYFSILKNYYKKALNKSDAIITNNQFFLDEMLKKFPDIKNKSQNLGYGIRVNMFYKRPEDINLKTKSNFNIPKDKVILLFAARLVKVKGLHILIDALSMIKENNFQLLVVGSPDFAKQGSLTDYEKLIYRNAEKLGDKIIFFGFLPQDKLALIYSVADIYVLPTIQPFEGGPQSLMEAMATECCTIGDFPELIENLKNGILVKSGDPSKLAESLSLSIKDKSLRLKLGKNARKTILENFTLEEYSKNLRNLFYEICNSTD